jgi:hypothetical protein
MRPIERWKAVIDIAEGERFEVSSRGRVRESATGKILKPTKTKAGYLVVRARWGGQRQSVTLHRLVAKAFLPGKPTFPVIFKDGRRDRCMASNLEWAHGNKKIIRYQKLTESDVRYIRKHWPSVTQRELAAEFGVCRQTISEVVTGKTFVGPRWESNMPNG